MSHIDLYRDLQLDPAATPQLMDAELARRLAQVPPTDTAALDQLTLARAILGQPQRRAAYDHHLGDPAAPPITVDTLRQIAAIPVAPAAAQPQAGVPGSQPLSAQTKRVLAIAGALVVLMAAVVLGYQLTGGDSGSTSGPSAGQPAPAAAVAVEPLVLTDARWAQAATPQAALVIDETYDLTAALAAVDYDPAASGGYGGLIEPDLWQLQDGSLAITWKAESSGSKIEHKYLLVDLSGGSVEVVESSPHDTQAVSQTSKIAVSPSSAEGQMNIVGDGIPDIAIDANPRFHRIFMSAGIPDSADPQSVWFLMPGSTDLYHGTLQPSS